MSGLPEVKPADASIQASAINTIVLGFAADPMTRWVWPDSSEYLRRMPGFVKAFGGRAFEHGTADVTEGTRAAALWLPPGVEPDDAEMGKAMEGALRPEIAEDIGAVLKGMAEHHPHEPHWYLPLIAADPNWIGRGLGALLMKHALRRCDEQGVAAYLESSNPRNISLYERHGFRIIGRIQSGSSPVLTPMLRPHPERASRRSARGYGLKDLVQRTPNEKRRSGCPKRRSSSSAYSRPAPRAHLYFAPSTATGISVE